jgi:hypothetical protein
MAKAEEITGNGILCYEKPPLPHSAALLEIHDLPFQH